jgi:excisionase family DNA binding protein
VFFVVSVMEHHELIGPPLLDKRALAKHVGVSVSTIDLWVYGRRIPFYRVGLGKRARIRFALADVQEHLARTRVAPITGEGC